MFRIQQQEQRCQQKIKKKTPNLVDQAYYSVNQIILVSFTKKMPSFCFPKY